MPVNSGDKFGRLTVLERAEPKLMPSGKRQQRWFVECECGTRKTVAHSSLFGGLTRSCGCLHIETSMRRIHQMHERQRADGVYNRLDLSGKKFGQLEVLSLSRVSGNATYWTCRCDCGVETEVKGALLKIGQTKSCGCRKSIVGKINGKKNAGRKNRVKRQRSREKYIGERFGRLIVQDLVYQPVAFAVCICDCGKVTESPPSDLVSGKKQSCGCLSGRISQPEQELFEFISDHAPDAIQDASICEIPRLKYDIVCPSSKLVFEFNGVVWHSTRFRKDADYHLEKRKAAEDAGYQMVSIWQDAWEADKPRMQELVLRRLGVASLRTIGARKCSIVEIDAKMASAIHDEHHIQTGKVYAGMNLALVHAGRLVAVASFKQNVLVRYTVLRGLSVAGGLKKLMKASGLSEIVTYADRDHFSGDLYRQSGFEKVGTSLQMTYLYKHVRYRRETFMKHKLPQLGISVEPGDTEKTALERAGIYQCFNSGVDKWIYRI